MDCIKATIKLSITTYSDVCERDRGTLKGGLFLAFMLRERKRTHLKLLPTDPIYRQLP